MPLYPPLIRRGRDGNSHVQCRMLSDLGETSKFSTDMYSSRNWQLAAAFSELTYTLNTVQEITNTAGHGLCQHIIGIVGKAWHS